MVKEECVRFIPQKDKEIRCDYKKAIELCKDHRFMYDINRIIDDLDSEYKEGIRYYSYENKTPKEAVKLLKRFSNLGNYLNINRKTLKMSKVLHSYYIGVVHRDERRMIFDPSLILNDLKSEWPDHRWHAHSIITINQPNLELGKHHHDYWEVFFTPTGGFKFSLADSEDVGNPRSYNLEVGDRLVIPAYIDHIVRGEKNSVLLSYGNVPFDPKRLIPSEANVLEAILAELNKD